MFKILVLGAKGVGKTTLISLYTGIAIQDMQQVSIKEIELIGQPYVVNMLDGDDLGEERITDDRTTYYPDIILILFHVLNQASLDTAYQYIQHYRDYYPLAHISILGTHTDLRNIPRIVSKEEIKDMCNSYYPQLWYFEVSRSDITSYESALLPSIAKIVFTNSLPKVHDQTEKEKLLYSVFYWCLMQKHDQLLEYLIEQRFFPPTRIIKEFPELTGKYIALKFPLTKYCVVTDKCVEIKKRINSNTVYEDDYDFTLDSDNHPIETKECVAEYNSNMQLDWSSLKFHYVYPTWFKLKSPECIVDRTVTIIKLSHNHLTSIPRELFNLKSLTYLDVSHNALTLLPGLWVLTSKLEVFLANDNNIGRISLEDMPYDYMFDVKNSGHNSEHNEFSYQNNEYNSRNIVLFNGPDLTSDILGLIENEYCLKVHNKIWMLQLQNNQLFELPLLFINYLPELEYLDISQNQINKILPGINFKQLKYLNVDNLPLIYPPKYIAEMGITNILRFMNQVSLNNPVMWHRHRIVVVGDQKSGKSSLIEKLIGKASYTPHIDGAALNINHWKVKSKTIQFWKKFQACFDIWEFSGKEIYQPIYSMFRPTSSLHIVVYNAEVYLTKLRPKESDDDPLKQFLRNLQVVVQDQKKRIKCVLVFTHMDLITKDQRELKRQLIIKSLRAYINDNNLVYLREFTKSESDIQTSTRSLSRGNKKYNIYSSSRNSLLPDVIDVLFVSGKTGEGISNLQKRLSQDILVSLDDASFVKQVPQSYIEIDMRIKMALDNIKSRGNNRTGNEQPFEKLLAKPFVCSEDILDKMLSSPSFKLEEELNLDSLQGMLRFFHEEGIIFQYSTSRNKCYISFNPEALAGAIALVINLAHLNAQSPSGLIKVNTISELFSNVANKNSLPCSLSMSKKKFEDSFYMDFECEGKESEIIHEDFLLFLNENNISVSLNQNNILIPASLPPKKPECMKETKDATPITCELSEMRLKRLYNIMFLPSNFWNILICTLLNNILPVVWPGGYKLENIKVFDDICPRHQQSPNANPIKFDDNQLPRKYRRVTNTFYNASTVQNMSDCTMTDEEIIFNENDSKIIYWKKGLFIRSASGWKIKVSASNEEESKSTLIRCKGGIEVSIYADLISVEARLLRIVHNTILRVIATKFPGLWGLSNINTPWVEVFSIYKTSSSYTETAKNNQHNRERYDRLIDILKSSVYPLSYHTVNKLLPKLETIPDILIKDLPIKLAVNQNERSSLYTSQEDDSVFSHLSDGGDAANGNELIGHFHRQLCNEKWVNQADRVNEGISQLNSLENPFKLIIREVNILLHLTHPTIVSLSGINLHPPILLLEKAPYGSLRDVLLEKRQLDHREAHSVAIEVLTALEHLHSMNICHSHLTSDSILIFSINPVCIKLSDKGLSHNPRQPLINTRVDQDLLLNQETALDILQFGFLLFEISTGHRPFEDVFSLQEVMRLAFHSRLTLNIEAYILFQIEEAKQNSTKLHLTAKRSSIISPCARTSNSSVCDYFELHKAEVSACHRLCMQPLLEICLDPKQRRNITTLTMHSRLILCAGNLSWSPLTSNINMQSIMTGMNSDLYWASGTRGLLVGNINTRTGKCIKRALTRPDKRRQNTEHIQAIGNVTCMTKVTATSQLWIGIENTTTGALYVYDMPGMKNYYHGQLQDAVLSILPIDKEWEKMKLLRPDLSEETCEGLKYRVLVGLANGNIIIFMGKNGQEVTENPLAGDKAVLLQTTKPCCSMLIAPNGLIWAACGDEILVLNPITLKEDPRYKGLCHTREQQSEVVYSKNFISKECVTSMVLSRVGIWTIARRCSVMWLWDWMTGELIAIFDLQKLPEIPPEAVEEVTTVAPQDDLLWVGTKSGLLILLDIDKIKSLLPKKTHKRLANSSSMEMPTNHRYSYLGQGNNKTFLDNSSLKEMRDIPQITGLSTETSPMIAYQECSIGKIRYIQPLSSKDITNDPEIACSVDRDMDEVSSRLMIWKFLSRAKIPRCQLKESANISSSEES